MEHMEKRKRNSETAGAAAQGGTPAGSRKHAAEPQGRRMERGAVAPGSAWALVTGAGSGIGRCYALRLAALGYRLVIVGNNAAPLEAVAGEIRRAAGANASASFPEVRVMPMDLARVGAAQELHDRTAAEGIEIDVVINNAGIFSFCDILTTPAERIERI
ncbi:SDR family NAD(P)-dependent oxidoreductase, partial [Alistipes sp.]|uniref:SDR family NAD(P)-dependent oxidoreductase n=1 Tax=Alistipes sp. TaxID=1872444 RepID=UPI0023EFEFD4